MGGVASVEFQQAALQLIGQRNLVQFAEKLNPILEAGQGIAQTAAIGDAGQLRAAVNLPALLPLAARQDPALEYPLVLALRHFPLNARAFLQRVFLAAHEAKHPAPGPWAARGLAGPEMQEFIRWSQPRDAIEARRRNSVIAATPPSRSATPLAGTRATRKDSCSAFASE